MDTGPLADVAADLKEAEGYERLALERRRGLVGLLMAVPFLAFLVWRAIDLDLDPLTPMGFGFAAGVMAYAGLLSFAVRRRPAWEPLFRKQPGKVRWIWLIVFVAYMLGTSGLPAFLSFRADWSEAAKTAALSLHVAGMVFIAERLSPRLSPIQGMWLGPLAASGLFLFGVLPSLWDFYGIVGAMLVWLFAHSVIRLLAPRRWLIR